MLAIRPDRCPSRPCCTASTPSRRCKRRTVPRFP